MLKQYIHGQLRAVFFYKCTWADKEGECISKPKVLKGVKQEVNRSFIVAVKDIPYGKDLSSQGCVCD